MGTGAARLKQLTDNMSTIKNDLKELEKLEPKVESVLSLTQILGDASKKVQDSLTMVNQHLDQASAPIKQLGAAKAKAGEMLNKGKGLF